MSMINNKRGFEFSFAWIFAIIVGAVIIFLAVWGVVQLIGTERTARDSEIGKELGILLNPIETSLESGKSALIKMPGETRLFNDCNNNGVFGVQKISAATKSGIGDEWERPGIPSSFFNKYVFSADVVQGEDYKVFVKPFEFPYKVGDLIFIWSVDDEYCFVNAPNNVEEDVEDLDLGISLVSSLGECSVQSKRVCFASSGCDVDVSLNSKSVYDGETKYYEGDLIYGAIFSGKERYECQVKRLMGRASELALLNLAKTNYLTPKGCSSNMENDLSGFANVTLNIGSSLDLRTLGFDSDDLGRRNNLLGCKLW